jgi:hypothetical protein
MFQVELGHPKLQNHTLGNKHDTYHYFLMHIRMHIQHNFLNHQPKHILQIPTMINRSNQCLKRNT